MTTNKPQSTTEPELKPCRCGREAIIEKFHDGDDPQPLFVATCEVCPVKTYDQFTAEEAARVWNEFVSATVSIPDGQWQHVQIKAGNPRVVAIQFETAEQATAFINSFAASPASTAPVVNQSSIQEHCYVPGKTVYRGMCGVCGMDAAVHPEPDLQDVAEDPDPLNSAIQEAEDDLRELIPEMFYGPPMFTHSAAATAAPVEQSAIDLDPLEFWCDLVEVLGHPRPVKVNPVSVIAEVEERLRQIPPTKEHADVTDDQTNRR